MTGANEARDALDAGRTEGSPAREVAHTRLSDSDKKPRPPSAKRLCQACALLILFLLSSWVGMTYVSAYGQHGIFFQRYYGPAVMLACGQGFVNPVVSASPALEDFLALRTRTLDVSVLPDPMPTAPLTQLQARWMYVLHAVGALWRVFGVSWDALLPLFGALFGFSTLALYFIFRLACGPRTALLAAAFLTLSPFNLLLLPDLRDYSKAPFILGCIACLGALVKHDLSWKKQLVLVSSLGAMLGIGLGFRKDVVICIPPGLLVCFALLPGNPLAQWKKRILLAMALVVSFLIAGWPLLSAMREKGGTTAHVMILGLAEPFDLSLGIGGAPYSFGQEYQDAYAHSMVRGYWQRHGDGTEIPADTPAYDRACRTVYRSFVKTFPADILTRWYAATERILNYGPFLTETWQQSARNPFTEKLFLWRWKTFYWLSGWGLALALFTAACLSVLRLRYALAYVLLVTYFTGYSSLQFQIRHFFHLEFSFWWPLFLAIGMLSHPRVRLVIREVLGGRGSRGQPIWDFIWPRAGVRLLAVAALLGAMWTLPPLLRLCWQDARVNALYDKFGRLMLEPLRAEIEELGAMSRVRPADAAWPSETDRQDPNWVNEEYLVIEFDATERIEFWTQYDPAHNNYKSRVDIEPSRGNDKSVRYFLPVFQSSSRNWYAATFQHLTIPTRYLPRIKGMYRVKNLADVGALIPMKLYADRPSMAGAYNFRPYMKPLYPRALAAARNGVISGGGFEDWDANGAPIGFDAPQAPVSLQRSEKFMAEGRSSAQLIWERDPGPTSIFSRFRTKPLKLEPGGTYELFLDCYNPAGLSVHVGVWEISESQDGRRETFRLTPTVVEFGTGRSFVRAAGLFTTTLETSSSVIITVSQIGTDYPATVYLDNLSLVRVD